MNREYHDTKIKPIGGVYSYVKVMISLAAFYFVIVAFDSKGIYYWSTKLPVNEWTLKIRDISFQNWGFFAKMGFENPKFEVESIWLDFQGSHRLLYPKKFVDVEKSRIKNISKNILPPSSLPANMKQSIDTKLVKDFQREIKVDLMQNNTKSKNILVIGDSLMMSVGPVIKDQLELKEKKNVVVRAKLSTGLSRPDVFDWHQELEQILQFTSFDSVIVMMGANDSQDFMEGGLILGYGTTQWIKAYRKRVQALMALICQNGAKGLWIGLPPMQSANFNKKTKRLNEWIARNAEESSCVDFMDSKLFFGDEKGRYTSYLTIEGRSEKVRTTDGIHITKKGATLLVDPILKHLREDHALAH